MNTYHPSARHAPNQTENHCQPPRLGYVLLRNGWVVNVMVRSGVGGTRSGGNVPSEGERERERLA